MSKSNLPFLLEALKSATPDRCIEWPFGRIKGYGHAYFEGKRQYTHRIAFQVARGPIPDGLGVCHHCDNPPCFNPFHLFPGDQGDNMQDLLKKGRSTATLTEAQVMEIRDLWPSIGYRMLAVRFATSVSNVHFICTGGTWKNLPLSERHAALLASGYRTVQRGIDASSTKLTEEQVREIRRMRGRSQRKIARKFGLGKSTVGAILRGETWTHLL